MGSFAALTLRCDKWPWLEIRTPRCIDLRYEDHIDECLPNRQRAVRLSSDKSFILVTLILRSKGGSMGNLWLGAFVGFLVTLILGWMFPGIGHLVGGLIGGFVAGLIAGGGMMKGALAGFLAGIFGGIIIAILAFIGLALVGGIAGGILGGIFGGIAGLAIGIIAIIFAIFGAIASTIGGLIGGLLAR
jgi:hypothetical protein